MHCLEFLRLFVNVNEISNLVKIISKVIVNYRIVQNATVSPNMPNVTIVYQLYQIAEVVDFSIE